MKIIEINTTRNSGSTGRIAAQIQKYVNDNGDLQESQRPNEVSCPD